MHRQVAIAALFAGSLLHQARPSTHAQSPAENAQTAAFTAKHQNPDGGFAPKPGQPSTIGATNSALKILKHVGGSVPDILGCVAFVKSCVHPGGGFSQTPGGKPDVQATAVGLMAATDLKIHDPVMIRQAVVFLGQNARSFEEVRMSIAGLEAVGVSSPDVPRWFNQIQALRNPDGTFGSGAEKAFATGGSAAAILRAGLKLDKKEAILAAIRAGQKPDGGWSRTDGPSDLSACYRIVRGLYMMRELPDADRLLGFIARCKKSDGSYSNTPDAPGDLGGTYTATIITYWIRQLLGLPAVLETAGFLPLVSGDDLTGWEGDTSLWSVRDGVLIGHSQGLDHNEFLATTKTFGDFVLNLNFKMVEGKGNSGVQFRSVRIPGHEMSGYQADLGDGYWGCLYDESRRNMVLAYPQIDAVKGLDKSGWNRYSVRAIGNDINLVLNNKYSVHDYVETAPHIANSGLIALQLHAGGPTEMQFKDVYIQPLPSPTADNPTKPGFHLRTVKTDTGDRKYSVYVPEGYDGTKPFPVILFLHGSGERGTDGVVCAQAGIGPAIFNRPGGIPAIVVIPQARRTWAAGSIDSKAALQALDDVIASYKTDPTRIVLTGLSMGGQGSWDLASTHPDRFSAVVPICGGGDPETIPQIGNLPVWTFCGDADSDSTVLHMREMVEGLRRAGNPAKITEYRGVGHNSWDRAYNNPELIDWMLAQHRPSTAAKTTQR
jgi:poly(3-hydroxybutyrate) depolymerase/prenyltransferase beta subunit